MMMEMFEILDDIGIIIPGCDIILECDVIPRNHPPIQITIFLDKLYVSFGLPFLVLV